MQRTGTFASLYLYLIIKHKVFPWFGPFVGPSSVVCFVRGITV
jgi:hypothetical protein